MNFRLFLAATTALAGGAVVTQVTGATAFVDDDDTVFISELHYDNAGTDAGEAIEVFGPAGTDLTGWSLVLYNGSTGAVYDTDGLAGTIPDLGGGAGVVVFGYPTNGIQNGSPDGIALVDATGAVRQFISYEGTFSAVGGPAGGLTSTDIGVSESSSTTAGESLQLGGTGSCYGALAWTGPASNTFGALGAIMPDASVECDDGGASGDPVINEFVANHTGADTEAFVEVLGDPSTDYPTFTVLEIEGDSSGAGVVDAVLPVGTTNAGGHWIDPEDMENGTITIMLVEDFTGAVGDDLDTDNDGVLDVTPWSRIVDDVATTDGGSSDITYSSTVLGPFFDGSPFGAGGASRIPDGTDTDTNADWLRNDFDGFGFPGFPGSPALGEAVNTPDAVNAAVTVPTDPVGVCGDPATLIHLIQGEGLTSPDVGSIREIEGVVVGSFQGSTGLNGFFVQEEDDEIDGDPLTSEGIFVFDPASTVALDLGDVVRVRGSVSEFFGLTQINNVVTVIDCNSSDIASPSTVNLPVGDVDEFEAVEGMAVHFPQTLYASGNFTLARYGEVDLSVGGPLDNPTNVVPPGAEAIALQDLNDRSRIQLDDGSNVQNPVPVPPYFAADGTLRTGDSVAGVTAVMSYAFGSYELHPTEKVTFERLNERPDGAPDVGGSMTVAAFNVLNYFTTIDTGDAICGPNADQGCRGADSEFEFDRQEAKLVEAIVALDSDVVGIIEVENAPDDTPIATLVDAINAEAGAGTYEYLATGPVGGDAIRVAFIYQPAKVERVGTHAILDSSVDPTFNDDKNRAALAQTFRQVGTDDLVTVAVNHLKSKGSPCTDVDPPDPDTGDGQGNCNRTRTEAAQALATWLDGDPTGSGSADNIIIGDLNAYAQEDPITVLEAAGYTDLIEQELGAGWSDGAYSYNFFSQSGYLDHGLASPSLHPRVTGADVWHINADEPAGLDYNSFNQPELFNPDRYRSSDHDPVVVGICEATAPVVDVSVTPDRLWPPNHKYRDVEATVSVTDADPNATITLLSVTSDEPDNGTGDGDTPDDIVIVDDFNFQLRAERSGGGDGRVYTITYQVTDSCGNTTIATATVDVPHDRGN